MEYTAHSRREFLAWSAGLGISWEADIWPAITADSAYAAAVAEHPAPATLEFLTADEGRDVEAVAAQIIPTKKLFVFA